MNPGDLESSDLRRQSAWYRSLIRIAHRFLVHIGLTTTLCAGVGYAIFAWPFFGRSPLITNHAARDFNTELDQTPPQMQAWPEIHRARRMQVDMMDKAYLKLRGGFYTEHSERGRTVHAMLERQKEILGVVAEAARRPRLGCFITPFTQNEVYESPAGGGETYAYSKPGEPDPFLWLPCMMGCYAELRGLGRDFAMRMDQSAIRGDGRAVVDDFETIVNLARLTADPPMTTLQLGRLAILASGTDALLAIVAAYPGVLGEADCARAQELLRGIPADWTSLDVTWERHVIEDLWQRLFSDDGAGNGSMTADGWRLLHAMSSTQTPEAVDVYVLGPLKASVYGSRRTAVDATEKMMALVEKDDQTPAWEWDVFRADAWADETKATPCTPVEMMIASMPEALTTSVKVMKLARLETGAAIVALAIERYRLIHGHPPEASSGLQEFGVTDLPIDTFSGLPIRYVLAEDGPRLYSVGFDRDDDGGATCVDWLDARTMMPREKAEVALRREASRYDGDWVFWPPMAMIDGDTDDRVVRPLISRGGGK